MAEKRITVIGAYENNLKDINVSIVKNKVTTISGVSGAGKSSLVNSVIYQNYSRVQRLDKNHKDDILVRPNFLSINNPFKTVLVSQKSPLPTESSTVATISGVNLIVRKHFLKNGKIICNKCSTPVDNLSSIQTIKNLIAKIKGRNLILRFLISHNEFFDKKKTDDLLKKYSINKIKISGNKKVHAVSHVSKLNSKIKYTIEGLIDISEFMKIESIPIDLLSLYQNDELLYVFSKQTFCGKCNQEFYVKSLSLFTTSMLSEFNGACGYCKGKGEVQLVNYNKLINKKPLSKVFLNIPHNGLAYKYCYIQDSQIKKIIKKSKRNNESNFYDIEISIQKEILDYITDKLIQKSGNKHIEKYIDYNVCSCCNGSGFNYKSNSVYIEGLNISDFLQLDISSLADKLKISQINKINKAFTDLLIPKMSLNRVSNTLSGGELQRLKLIKYLADDLKDYLIIIDEPSKGLSSSDITHVFSFLSELARVNTVILVDHSNYVIKNSDYNLHFGPHGGAEGGRIVKNDFSDFSVDDDVKNKRHDYFEITNINCNTVINQDVKIPYSSLTAIFGISGSGKSSLIRGVINLLPQVKHNFDGFVFIEQKEVSANHRSTIASYLEMSETIRNLYSNVETAKALQLKKEFFSANTELGMCSICNGSGKKDNVTCYSCLGGKLNFLSNLVLFDKKNITEYISLSINELKSTALYKHFSLSIDLLINLGLGHLSLNRETPSLSGGESQRLKLAKYINSFIDNINSIDKHLLIILDEPMRGLSNKDAIFVFQYLRKLRDSNNTVLIVEHNSDIIFSCDYLIKLGPSSGVFGGKVEFNGYPEEYNRIEREPLINRSIVVSEPVNSVLKLSKEDDFFEKSASFLRLFKVDTIQGSFIFFDKYVIREKLISYSCYYFNPFCLYLNRTHLISKTTFDYIFNCLFNLGFDKCILNDEIINLETALKLINVDNVWDFKVKTNNVDLALEFGSGWVSILEKNKLINYSLRVLDLNERVIGSRLDNLHNRFFNIYFNSCPYCNGEGENISLDSICFNKNSGILDMDFYPDFLKSDMKKIFFRLKEQLKTFEKEGLVDLNLAYRDFSEQQVLAFLYGIPNHSYLKVNGRKSAIEDNITWDGIYRFLYLRMNKLSKKSQEELSKSLAFSCCPFCKGTKYSKEFEYYHVDGERIWDYAR